MPLPTNEREDMLKITERLLDKVQEDRAKALVIEVMKLIDNYSDKKLLKSLIKENIYGSFRELANTIRIFNEGLVIEFKPKGE